MDGVVAGLVSAMTGGGNSAIVAILIFICYALWSERQRLLAENEVAQRRLDAVAQAQAQATRDIVDSVAAVRIAIIEGDLRRVVARGEIDQTR